MPLNPASLQSSLESLFSNPPLTRAACAQAWANAINGYATAIVPASSTVAAGCAVLSTALAAAFAAPSAAPAFDAAFTALGAAIAGGMIPPPPLVAPPPAPLNVAALLAVNRPTHAVAAAAFATQIDVWFRTGTIVLGLIPWS